MRTRPKHRVIFAATALASAAISPLAFAQTTDGPSQEISLSISVKHDSNIARSSRARAIARGLERADERITPSLNVNIERNLGRHTVGLEGSLGYDFHRRNTQLDRERIFVRPKVELNFPICSASLQAEFSRQQSDLGDYAFAGVNGPAGVRNTETRQDYSGELRCGRPGGLRPTLGIGRTIGENSNPLRERADFNSTEFLGGLSYDNATIGEFLLYVSKRKTDLPSQIVAGSEDGYDLTSYGLRFKRDIGTRFDLDAGAAIVNIDPKNPILPSRSNFIWDASVTAQIGTRLQIAGTMSSNVTNTLTSDAVYNKQKTYALRAIFAVNDRLRLNAGVSSSPRRYIYAVTPAQPYISKETQRSITGGLSYEINRRFRLAMAGGYQERDADQNFFDYSGKFVSLTLSAKF